MNAVTERDEGLGPVATFFAGIYTVAALFVAGGVWYFFWGLVFYLIAKAGLFLVGL